MAVKILFAPNHPKPILDVALKLKPPGFDLLFHDHGAPEYYRAAADARYYLGMTRNIDARFFEAAKNMKTTAIRSMRAILPQSPQAAAPPDPHAPQGAQALSSLPCNDAISYVTAPWR